MTTYTVKIVNTANQHNGETCGHSHRSEETAMECRMKFTERLKLAWTDGVVVEVEK